MVGDTVKQYASEDATVVVGSVIDPEMTDEIRVTVVATGIGRPSAVRGMPAHTLPPKVEVVRAARVVGRSTTMRTTTSDELPAPPRAVGDGVRADAAGDDSYLDIPRSSAGRPTERRPPENRGPCPISGLRGEALRRFRGNGDSPGCVIACPAERSASCSNNAR